MADVYAGVRTRSAPAPVRKTPARSKAVAGQVRNAAGGQVFSLPDEARLHRFLTMGTEGGTYYRDEQTLTRENADVVVRAAEQAPLMLVKAILAVSEGGRAPKQQPALFALAIASSLADDAGRKAALAAVPAVCRTVTSLFTYMKYCDQFRGWGRGLRKAVGRWYDEMPADKLAVQLVKYRQREGYTHTDALRLASDRGHGGDYLATVDAQHAGLYNYVTKKSLLDKNGRKVAATLPEVILAYEALQTATTLAHVVKLVAVDGVTWEMIPDKWINEPAVWEALILKGLPVGALIRQLPRITRAGLTSGEVARKVISDITDAEKLKWGRVHPMKLLVASKTYASGHSERGNSTWPPFANYITALTDGFYEAYAGVVPAGKTTLVGVDISDSMRFPSSVTPGYGSMTAIEATAANALVTAATEPDVTFVAFNTGAALMNGVSARRWIPDVMADLRKLVRGGTDCSMPIRWALENRVKVDTIQILTDGESHQGSMHPFEAMKIYRDRINPDARLVTVAMTATGTSIVPPFDDKSLDVCGFDASVPQLAADFSAGRI